MHRFIDGEDRMQQTLLPHCLGGELPFQMMPGPLSDRRRLWHRDQLGKFSAVLGGGGACAGDGAPLKDRR
jgi:hypothetical protein